MEPPTQALQQSQSFRAETQSCNLQGPGGRGPSVGLGPGHAAFQAPSPTAAAPRAFLTLTQSPLAPGREWRQNLFL